MFKADSCVVLTNPCHNGGTCVDTGTGNYTCTCATGYSGSNCDVCMLKLI